MPKFNSQTNYYDKKDLGHTSTYETVKRSYDRLTDKEKQLVNYEIQTNPDKYTSSTSTNYKDDPLYNSSLQARGLDAYIPDDWQKQIPKKNGVFNAIDSDGSINEIWQRAYDNLGILRPFLKINSKGTPDEESYAGDSTLQNLAYRRYKQLQKQYEDEAEVESWKNRVYQKDGVIDEAMTRAFQELTTEEKKIINSLGSDGKPSAVATVEQVEAYNKLQAAAQKYRGLGSYAAYNSQVFANPDGTIDKGKTKAYRELTSEEQAIIQKLGKNGYPSGLVDAGDLAVFNKFDDATQRYNREYASQELARMQSGTKYANSTTVSGGSSAVNLSRMSDDEKKSLAKKYNLSTEDVDDLIKQLANQLPADRRERIRSSLGAPTEEQRAMQDIQTYTAQDIANLANHDRTRAAYEARTIDKTIAAMEADVAAARKTASSSGASPAAKAEAKAIIDNYENLQARKKQAAKDNRVAGVVQETKALIDQIQALDEERQYYETVDIDGLRKQIDLIDQRLNESPTNMTLDQAVEYEQQLKQRKEELQVQIHQAESVQTYAKYMQEMREAGNYADELISRGVDKARQDTAVYDRYKAYERNGKISFNISSNSRVAAVEQQLENAAQRGLDYRALEGEERRLYEFVLGRDGQEAADRLLDALRGTLNYRRGEQLAKSIAETGGVERFFRTVGLAINVGLDQFDTGMLAATGQADEDRKYNATVMENASAITRERLGESGAKLPEWLGGATFAQAGYDALTTTANMAPAMLISAGLTAAGLPQAAAGVVSAAVLGSSAGGNAYRKAIQEGRTETAARNFGVLTGASEGTLQYLIGGISALGGMATGATTEALLAKINSVGLRAAAEIGIDMLSEGSEEYWQDILEPVFRNICFDEKNQVRLWSEDAAYSFLLGAITAGLMEGPSTVTNAVNQQRITEARIAAENWDYIANLIEESKQAVIEIKPEAASGAELERMRLYTGTYEEGTTQVLVPQERYDAVVNSSDELVKAADHYAFLSNDLTQQLQSGRRMSTNEIRQYAANLKAAQDKLAQTQQAMTAARSNFDTALKEAQTRADEAMQAARERAEAERVAEQERLTAELAQQDELYELYRGSVLTPEANAALVNIEDTEVALRRTDVDAAVASGVATEEATSLRNVFDELESVRSEEERLNRRIEKNGWRRSMAQEQARLEELQNQRSILEHRVDEARDAYVTAARSEVMNRGAQALGTRTLASAQRLSTARWNTEAARTATTRVAQTEEQATQAQQEYDQYKSNSNRRIHWSRQSAINRISDPGQPLTRSDIDLALKSGIAPRQARALAEAYNAAVEANQGERDVSRLQDDSMYTATRREADRISDVVTLRVATTTRERLAIARADFAAAARTMGGASGEAVNSIRTLYSNLVEAQAALRGAQNRLDAAYESQNDMRIQQAEDDVAQAEQAVDAATQEYNDGREAYVGGANSELAPDSQAIALPNDGSVQTTQQQHAAALQAPARATTEQLNAAVDAVVADPEASRNNPTVQKQVMAMFDETESRERQDDWQKAKPAEKLEGTDVNDDGIRYSTRTGSYLDYKMGDPDPQPAKGGPRSLVHGNDLIRTLFDAFNVTGRVRNDSAVRKGAAAYYNPRTGFIQLKSENNVPAAIHEVGHRADFMYELGEIDGIDGIWQQFPQKVKDFYNNDVEALRAEAKAEAFKMYVNNPEYARQFWPQFVETLEANMDRVQRNAVQKVSQAVRDEAAASIDEQIGNTIKDPTEGNNKLKNLWDSIYDRRRGFEGLAQAMTDVEAIFSRLDSSSAKQLGGLSKGKQLYVAAKDLLSVSGRAMYMLTNGGIVVERNGQHVREKTAYADIFKNLTKEQVGDVAKYLKTKEGLWRENRQNKKVFPDTIDREAAVKWLYGMENSTNASDQAVVKAAEEAIEWFHTFMSEVIVPTGLISKASWVEFVAENPNYVPMQRDLFDEQTGGTGSDPSTPITRKMVGSEADTIDPIIEFAEVVQRMLAKAERAKFDRELYQRIKQLPDSANFAQIVNVRGVVDRETLTTGPESMFWTHSAPLGMNMENDILPIRMEDGSLQYLQLNDAGLKTYYENVTRYADTQRERDALMNNFGKFLHSMTRLRANLLTGINVQFALRNPQKDFVEYATTSETENNPAKLLLQQVQGFIEVAKNRRATKEVGDVLDAVELYQYMGGSGGLYGSLREVDTLRNLKGQIVPQTRSKFKKLRQGANDILSYLGEIGEQGTRVAEFKRVLEKSKGDVRLAFYEANRSTVDFRGSGTATGNLKNVMLFMGASLNSFNKDMRSLTGKEFMNEDGSINHKAQAAWLAKKAAYIAVPAMLQQLIRSKTRDDEDELVPDYMEDSDFLMPIPGMDGFYLRWALPEGATNATFREIGQMAGRLLSGEDMKFFESFCDIKDALSPIGEVNANTGFMGSSFALAPLIQAALNRRWNGGTIDSDYDSTRSPELAYSASTTELAKALGRKWHISPKRIDYVLDQSLSWIYDDIKMIDNVWTGKTSFLSAPQELLDGLTSRFITNVYYNTDALSEFYSAQATIDTITNDIDSTDDHSSPKYRDGLSEEELERAEKEANDLKDEFFEYSRSLTEIRNQIKDLTNKGTWKYNRQMLDLQKQYAELAMEGMLHYELFKENYLK